MISQPRYGLVRNALKQGWPLLAYLLWEIVRYAQQVLEAAVWSEALVTSGLQLAFEVTSLAVALSLMVLQNSTTASTWPQLREYSEEIKFLGPLVLWILFVLAMHSSRSLTLFTSESMWLAVGGLTYALWLVWARRRERAIMKPFEMFRTQLEFPVTRIADSLARVVGYRITTTTPIADIDELKFTAMEAMLKRLSLYVHGDERGLKMLRDLMDWFPSQSKLSLASHALYRLQEAYGAHRFGLMATTLADAYERTVDSSRDAIADAQRRISAQEFDSDADAAKALTNEVEALKIGPRVQESFTNELFEKLPPPN